MIEAIRSALAFPADPSRPSKPSKSKKSDAKAAPASSFYAIGQLASGGIGITVKGLGALTFPLQPQQAEALIHLSQPAAFGLGERTLIDKRVRDIHEIGADTLDVTWHQTALDAMLDGMRATLGLPANARLVPHLHNLLIYESGQFFKPHQDSEKLDGMVASLIVVLPSAHIGGELRIRLGEEKYAFVTENLSAPHLQCVAFYADCTHELTVVKQGFRIGLSYNLVLESEGKNLFIAGLGNHAANASLDSALSRYFSDTRTNASDAADRVHGEDCFVYLLDHSYTEHSLRWHFLKGDDVRVARLLTAAAQRLGFTLHLAQAEVHQTWSADCDFGDPRHYDEDDDDDDGEDDDFDVAPSRPSAKRQQASIKKQRALPAADDLIDEAVTLSTWIDARGERVTYQPLGGAWIT